MAAAMAMKVTAALDGDGQIADWHYELWSNTHSMRPNDQRHQPAGGWYLAEPQMHGPPRASRSQFGGGADRNAVPLYDFPNQKIVQHLIPQMPIRASALRTLGAYSNVFASESFMDEMAALAKADPVAFRLAHMKDPRARAVIEKVAAMANWKPGEAGSLSPRPRHRVLPSTRTSPATSPASPTSRSTARPARCACRTSGPRPIPGWSSIRTG